MLQKLDTLFLILLLVELRHVQALVNVSWDGLNLGSQFLFNSVKSKPVIIGDQVDRDSKVAESKIGLMINCVDTSRGFIRSLLGLYFRFI